MPTLTLSTLIFFVLSFFSTLSQAQAESAWELKKDQNGIMVYTRTLKDSAAGSETIEFKAITTLPADPEKILAVLTNTEKLPTWRPNLKAAKILNKIGADSWHEYNILSVPWPLDDRDVVLIKKITRPNEASDSFFLHIESAPNVHPQQDDLVRVNKAKGFWQLAPLGEGNVKITYQFYADPELEAPTWLMDLFAVDGPYKSLEHIRRLNLKAS